MNPVAAVGRRTLSSLASFGRLSLFAGTAMSRAVLPPYYLRHILRQMLVVGYNSLPVVGLTALFTGFVLARQIYIGTGRYSAESTVPQVVVFAITRELGPVLAGLMVAGRVSAAMAAEIGTMRVTEQIDALRTLATDPFRYLIAPRLWAATLTLPILVLVGDSIGVFGGYVMATTALDFNGHGYLQASADFLEASDVISGLVKAAVFGFLIALMGCYHGFNSQGGAQGVGRAATTAVVTASVLIFMANYLITELAFAS